MTDLSKSLVESLEVSPNNRVLADKWMQRIQPSAEQTEMLARIRGALGSPRRPGANGAQSRIGTKSQRRLPYRSGT